MNFDKGTVSNWIAGAVFGVGLTLPESQPQALVFSVGLFALSGGVTNWLAVKMLFDRIPGLVGSGVIPARFREIRGKVRDLILENFFSEEYLHEFFEQHQKDIDWSRYLKSDGGNSPLTGFIEQQWNRLTTPEVVQPIIDEQIGKLAESSIGGLLLMVGMDNVRPAVNRFVTSFVASMQDRVLAIANDFNVEDLSLQLDEDLVVSDIRTRVEHLLEHKLQQLKADDVKQMMEDVMRKHLGWLVVWGNVFGGLLGVAAYFLTK